MLDLPWSTRGLGASLEAFVAASPAKDELAPQMPRTMPGTLSFSFAGLHSAVERFVTARGGSAALDESTRHALATAFQRAAVGQLEEKVLLALKWCGDQGLGVRHLVVSGGVASNSYLRDRLSHCVIDARQDPVSLVFPPPELCTDNAVMIGWASMHRFLAEDTDDYSVMIRPKWSIDAAADDIECTES